MTASEKTIQTYIRLEKKKALLLFVLIGLLCIGTIGALYFYNSKENSELTLFDPTLSEEKDYCYFDAVGISPWMYHKTEESSGYKTSTTYYLAEDKDGYMIVAIIPNDYITSIKRQTAYWNRETEMPDPYRLTGLVKEFFMGNKDREKIIERLQISEEEFSGYFGDSILTVGNSPRKNYGAVFEVIALFSGVGLFVYLCLLLSYFICHYLSFKNLKKKDLVDLAANELEAASRKTEYVKTEHFLFVKNEGVVLELAGIKEKHLQGKAVLIHSDILTNIQIKMDSSVLAEKLYEDLSEIPQ